MSVIKKIGLFVIGVLIIFGVYFSQNNKLNIVLRKYSKPKYQEYINTFKNNYNNHLSDLYCLGNSINIGKLSLNKDEYDPYLIARESYDLNEYFSIDEKYRSFLTYRYDDEKAQIEDDILIPKQSGDLKIVVVLKGKGIELNFRVTDLIVKMADDDNFDKPDLMCNVYAKEDNDLLDEILKYRIDQAGYMSRGAVVACSRFLLLEFPYHLKYFYEYGRQTYGEIDGEGRYYLEGLYLDESRFDRLMGSNTYPATWGCPLYSYESNKEEINGLDCSGFVTWVLLNSGFDCGDIGAGISDYYDLTETGELKENSLDMIKEIKAGDLVHNDYMSGHIGIIIGINDEYIYVAQASPKDDIGVGVSKYTYEEFINEWDETVLMDSYYINDGNYSNMWH